VLRYFILFHRNIFVKKIFFFSLGTKMIQAQVITSSYSRGDLPYFVSMENKNVAKSEESVKKLRVCMYTLKYVCMYHHHQHQHIGCRILGLVTCSEPSNSLEVFEGSSLSSFPTRLIHNCVHSPNVLYLFISVILNLLHNWVNFKFR
jgi:hypothetical protein